MKAIMKNLKDQILTKDNKSMRCVVCGSEYSANAGDYWNISDPEYVFKCCNEPMILGHEVQYFQEA